MYKADPLSNIVMVFDLRPMLLTMKVYQAILRYVHAEKRAN